MKIPVVIVTYNSVETIEPCIESLLKAKDLIDEIFVVDNASTDKTVERVRKFNRVKLIQNKNNLGFAAANNIGIKQSKSPYIFLLNPDAKVESGLDLMIEKMEGDKKIGILGPKIVDPRGVLQKEIRKFPNLLDQILLLLRLHRFPLLKNFVYPMADYEKEQEVEHLMGAALLISRKLFEKVGLFDENFFVWFEETDLEKRAKDAGSKTVYFPKAKVSHQVAFSTRRLDFLKKQTIWNQSLLYYFKKHQGLVKILLISPFIIFSYIPAAIAALKRSIG